MLINLLCPIFHLDRQPIQLILVSSCSFVCFSDHEDAFNIPVSACGNARLHVLPKTMAANASTSSGLHLLQSTLRSREVQTERKTPRTDYFHHGRQICMTTFCCIHAVSRQHQHSASTTGQIVLSPASMSVQRNCLQMPCRLKTPNLSLHYEFCRGPWDYSTWTHVICEASRCETSVISIGQLFTDIMNISCRQRGHLPTALSFVFGKPCVQ